MKNKIMFTLGIAVLTLMLAASFVSALNLVSSPTSLSFAGSETRTLVITNSQSDGNFTITDYNTSLTFEDSNDDTATFVVTPLTSLTNTNRAEFNVTLGNTENIDLGSYTVTLNLAAQNVVTPTTTDALTVQLTFNNNEFCELGNTGDLDITIRDVQVSSGLGEDSEWYLGDEVDLEIRVENNGNEDIDDIVVEWCLYNPATGECVLDDEEKSFDLNDGDDETINIQFNLDPDDFDSDDSDYTFLVKAYSDDLGEDVECSSDSESIEVIIEDDFVVLDSIELTPETVQCGQELQITADVWNIGADDQDDVSVTIVNSQLGLNQRVEIGDIDSFDKEKLTFTFTVPTGIDEKAYSLKFAVYDEDEDVYEDADDDPSEFTETFTVQGNCVFQPEASVVATVDSGGNAGEDLVIKLVVTNEGSKSSTFVVEATDYEDWAELSDISSEVLVIPAGQSKESLLTFAVDKDASGEKIFNVDLKSDGSEGIRQPVSVSITRSSGFGGFTGFSVSSDNWYLWGIGVLNVVLIIIIVVVALRIARS